MSWKTSTLLVKLKDKNSGNGGANDLAKRVMQELQQHPDWEAA